MVFFKDIEKCDPVIYLEATKTLNSQSNPEEKEQCCRYNT
jgi:hypothetical protein